MRSFFLVVLVAVMLGGCVLVPVGPPYPGPAPGLVDIGPPVVVAPAPYYYPYGYGYAFPYRYGYAYPYRYGHPYPYRYGHPYPYRYGYRRW